MSSERVDCGVVCVVPPVIMDKHQYTTIIGVTMIVHTDSPDLGRYTGESVFGHKLMDPPTPHCPIGGLESF